MSENTLKIEPVTDSTAPRPWMRRVLYAAAAYNLVWGAVTILFPESQFRLLNVSPLPNYPELWQCIGMIVGVYGIGYAIAARHPFIHWPIVLVGLLGKVFGPIGFAWAVMHQRLPLSFGLTCIPNDLIWWIPFSIILWRAIVFHQSSAENVLVSAPVRRFDPLGRILSNRGASLLELSRMHPVLAVFLRHSGCTFCREAVADIAEQRERIEATGTKIAIIHMGQKEPVELLKKYNLQDVHSFRDPSCSLYDAFGLRLGTIGQLMGPSVWFRGFSAWLRGHSAGAFDGNVLRMPGIFLLHDGEIVRAYRHRTAADRPDYAQLARLPESSAHQQQDSETPVASGQP
ncbi:MAG: SelL-related redox protein [Planctomycetaceae bacterium]